MPVPPDLPQNVKRPPASATLMTMGLELLAVGAFTLIAGANDEIGSIVLLFMAGLWIIYLITESSIIGNVENGLANLVQNPSGK
jgi:hypothetical protein